MNNQFNNRLLYLSISLVRSKLIYGQEVYFSAPDTPLKKVQSIDSKAIKLAIVFRCIHTGRDRHPRRWGKRETLPNATLSPPGGGERGRLYLTLHCHHQEVEKEGDSTCHHQNDSALTWVAMRVILMFHYLWGTKSQDSVHRPQLLKRENSRSGSEPGSFRLPVLTPCR